MFNIIVVAWHVSVELLLSVCARQSSEEHRSWQSAKLVHVYCLTMYSHGQHGSVYC